MLFEWIKFIHYFLKNITSSSFSSTCKLLKYLFVILIVFMLTNLFSMFFHIHMSTQVIFWFCLLFWCQLFKFSNFTLFKHVGKGFKSVISRHFFKLEELNSTSCCIPVFNILFEESKSSHSFWMFFNSKDKFLSSVTSWFL